MDASWGKADKAELSLDLALASLSYKTPRHDRHNSPIPDP